MLHFKYLLNLKHVLDDILSERLALMLTESHSKIPIFLEISGPLMGYANNNNLSILKSFFAWYSNEIVNTIAQKYIRQYLCDGFFINVTIS